MTLTRSMIKRLRFFGRMGIDRELEGRLLRQFGCEPYPNEYTEQDLYEQVRKYVMLYNQERGIVSKAF